MNASRPRLRQQNFGLTRSRDQDGGLEDYKTASNAIRPMSHLWFYRAIRSQRATVELLLLCRINKHKRTRLITIYLVEVKF